MNDRGVVILLYCKCIVNVNGESLKAATTHKDGFLTFNLTENSRIKSFFFPGVISFKYGSCVLFSIILFSIAEIKNT